LLSEQTAGIRYVKQVNMEIGAEYTPTALFSDIRFLPLGVVENYEIQW
jgi:hypothetical protein